MKSKTEKIKLTLPIIDDLSSTMLTPVPASYTIDSLPADWVQPDLDNVNSMFRAYEDSSPMRPHVEGRTKSIPKPYSNMLGIFFIFFFGIISIINVIMIFKIISKW